MEAMIRAWIGEARAEDQRRIWELTAEVQIVQQARGAQAGPGAFSTQTWGSHWSSVARVLHQLSRVHPVHGRPLPPTWWQQWKTRHRDLWSCPTVRLSSVRSQSNRG